MRNALKLTFDDDDDDGVITPPPPFACLLLFALLVRELARAMLFASGGIDGEPKRERAC
jgi:hypothetical protein